MIGRERAAQPLDGRGLADPGIGVGRVGQHHDLEGARCAPICAERLGHRLQGRGGARRILVVDRHHQRGERAAGTGASGPGAGSRRFEAPASTEPAENAIQASDTAKKKIISPCSNGHAREAHDLQHLIDAVDGDADG